MTINRKFTNIFNRKFSIRYLSTLLTGLIHESKGSKILKMAEAFPEDLHEAESPDDSRRVISVLLLGTRWQFDTYGLSTINKSLVNNLRLVDPEGKSIKITCAVLQDDGKIQDQDLKEAEKYRVELKGAKRPKGAKRGEKPELQWLDKNTAAYYHHLEYDSYDFIIGHAPYVANGCLNLKELYKVKKESPKIILMFHALPKDENGDVDDEMLLEWLEEAEVVFSIGKAMENELGPYILALDPKTRPIHKLYFPSYPLELFELKQDSAEAKIWGTQNVCMMSGEIKDLDINGLDFPLAVTATATASEYIHFNDRVKTKLSLLMADEEEKPKWKKTLGEILRRRNLNDTGLSFQAEAPMSLSKMKVHMRKSNLFLLPLKPDSPLFGTEALAAIAAGVPVLVSRDSGLASLLDTMIEDESIVGKNQLKVDAQSWKEHIIQKLVRPEESQQTAKRLREQFLLDTNIAQTHLDFINVISGMKYRYFFV